MKKTLLICGMLLALSASLAQAQGGVNWAWQACLSDGGVLARNSACSSNLGVAGSMFGSYMLGADQNNFVGIEVVIDLQTESAALPAYWNVFNAGSCRPAGISAAFSHPGGTNCVDPWGGQAFGAVAAYQTSSTVPPVPGGAPNRGRIKVGGTVAVPIALPMGLELYGFTLNLQNAATTTCAGCTTPATIVLNEIAAVEQDGTRQRLTSPLQGQCVGWQFTPSPTHCGATPSKNTSWGQVKSLYR